MKTTHKFCILLLIVLLFFETNIFQTLNVLSAYIHQIGHLLMALTFSYNLGEIIISITGNSYQMAKPEGGFSLFLIACSGYLANVFFAFCVLYLKHSNIRKYILPGVALIFAGISFAYLGISEDYKHIGELSKSELTSLAQGLKVIIDHYKYTAIFLMIILMTYLIKSEKINGWIIDFIGVSSIGISIHDTFMNCIIYELKKEFQVGKIQNLQPYTDTEQLELITNIPSLIWGLVFFTITTLAVWWFFVNYSEEGASKEEVK